MAKIRAAGVALALAMGARHADAAVLAATGPRECADAAEIAFRVERSIGMPLAEAPPLAFNVAMERRGEGYAARIEVTGEPPHATRLTRELSAADCGKLVDAVSVAVALALGVGDAKPEAETLPSTELANGAGVASAASTTSATRDINVVDGNDVPMAANVIEIGDNPELALLAFQAGFRAAEMLSIYRNEKLSSVDLGSIERLDRLYLHGNTALTEVALGSLQTVDSLSVVGNSSLSTATLKTVRTFDSVFSDNADDPPAAL